MVKITYITPQGEKMEVEAEAGLTVMEAAVKNMVPGIDADCGGACACATCHVYVAPEWVEKVGKAEEMEASMLDFAQDIKDNSRLSCQVQITQEMDGLVVTVPEYQG